jgi:hypothetical protein
MMPLPGHCLKALAGSPVRDAPWPTSVVILPSLHAKHDRDVNNGQATGKP